jgi:hypothetical protein
MLCLLSLSHKQGQSVDDGIGMGKKVRQDDDDGFSEVVPIPGLWTICMVMDDGGSYLTFDVVSHYQCCQFKMLVNTEYNSARGVK